MCHAKRLLELPNSNLIEAVCWIINLFPREHKAHWTSQCWEPREMQGERERERNRGEDGGRAQRGELCQPTPPSHEPCQSATHYTTQSGHDVIRHIIALVTGLRARVCVQKGIKKSTFQQLNTNRRVWKRAKPKEKGREKKERKKKEEGIKARAGRKHHEMMVGIFVVIIVVGVQRRYKEERLTSVFNVCISLPPPPSPPPSRLPL